MVITGWPKIFAAGANISEMAVRPYDEMYAADWFEQWEGFTAVRAQADCRCGRRIRFGLRVRSGHDV